LLLLLTTIIVYTSGRKFARPTSTHKKAPNRREFFAF
jgi:hypothetical protein